MEKKTSIIVAVIIAIGLLLLGESIRSGIVAFKKMDRTVV